MLNFTLAKSVPYAAKYMNRLQLANYGIKHQKIEFQTANAVFFHRCLAGLQALFGFGGVHDSEVTIQEHVSSSYCKSLA